MKYTEGHTKLYSIWKYLLETYKIDGELPEEHWAAEEIIKEAIELFVADEIAAIRARAAMRVTVEEMHTALLYGNIVRFRGVQLWPGKDSRGLFLDVHVTSDNDLERRAQVEIHDGTVQSRTVQDDAGTTKADAGESKADDADASVSGSVRDAERSQTDSGDEQRVEPNDHSDQVCPKRDGLAAGRKQKVRRGRPRW